MRSSDVHDRRLTRRWTVTALLFAVFIATSTVSSGASVQLSTQLRRVTTVSLTGHGWGSGIGMGQWGAFGYAVRYHFGYERILNRYYGGTNAATLGSLGQVANPTISVVINENLNLTTNVGYDPIVTSAVAFTVTSNGGAPATTSTTVPPATTTLPTTTTVASTSSTTSTSSTSTSSSSTSTTVAPTTTPTTPSLAFSVPAGTAVDLRLSANGTWNAYEGSSCALAGSATTSSAPIATGLVNPIVSPSVPSTAPPAQLLVLCRHDGVDESLRGSVEAFDRSGYERTLNLLPLESYLQGVVPSESSASWGNDGGSVGAPQGEPWGFQALEAQSVAARSYAMAYGESGGWNGYATICDTTTCQVYSGANYETTISNAAVVGTAGEIRVRPSAPSVAVSTQYSASTGGYTAPSTFGVVQDLGDACVLPGTPLECNPNHIWQLVVDAASLMKHYPQIGRLLSVHVAARSGAGAYGGRTVTVILRGKRSTIRVSGNSFTDALGLKSNWFAIERLTRVAAPVATTTPATTSTTLATPITSSSTPATTTSIIAPSTATTTTTIAH